MTLKKGFAFVDYNAPMCAERASAALNGFTLDGRTMTVKVQDPATMKVREKSEVRFAPY